MNRLRLSKTAAIYVAPGKSLTYTLTVSNQHVFPVAHNLQLADTLPVGTGFITATPPYLFDGQKVTWQLAQLTVGQSWQVSMVISVPLSFQGNVIENWDYWVTSDELYSPIAGYTLTTPLRLPYVYYFPFFSRS